MKSQNPENKNQARLFYCARTAFDHGEMRHPSIVIDEMAGNHNIKVLGKIPQSLFDGWDFWVEIEESQMGLSDVLDVEYFFNTPFFMDYGWKPINEA